MQLFYITIISCFLIYVIISVIAYIMAELLPDCWQKSQSVDTWDWARHYTLDWDATAHEHVIILVLESAVRSWWSQWEESLPCMMELVSHFPLTSSDKHNGFNINMNPFISNLDSFQALYVWLGVLQMNLVTFLVNVGFVSEIPPFFATKKESLCLRGLSSSQCVEWRLMLIGEVCYYETLKGCHCC